MRKKTHLAAASRRGGEATKAKYEALLRGTAEKYRPHWGDPRFETAWILERVGCSLNTMNKYLGCTRKVAIAANREALQAQALRQRRQTAREAVR